MMCTATCQPFAFRWPPLGVSTGGGSDWFSSDQVSDVSSRGGYLWSHVGVGGGGYPRSHGAGGLPLPCDLSHNACVVRNPPPPRDPCENITFPQHLWREVINNDFSKGDVHIDNFKCPDWSPF